MNFQIREIWNQKDKKTESSIAKATYIKKTHGNSTGNLLILNGTVMNQHQRQKQSKGFGLLKPEVSQLAKIFKNIQPDRLTFFRVKLGGHDVIPPD